MRGGRLHHLLAGGAAMVGEGTVPGRLLGLRGYPGLIPGRGRVRGEHHRGRWTDVGTPERLAEIDRQVRASQA